MSIQPELQPILNDFFGGPITKRGQKPIQDPNALKTRFDLEKAVANWTKKPNDCGCAHFFYRVGQAILAIFGKSDWQIARKSLTAYFIKRMTRDLNAITKTIPLIGSSLQLNESNLPKGLEGLISKVSNVMLNVLLKSNHHPKMLTDDFPSPEFDKKYTTLEFLTVATELSNLITIPAVEIAQDAIAIVGHHLKANNTSLKDLFNRHSPLLAAKNIPIPENFEDAFNIVLDELESTDVDIKTLIPRAIDFVSLVGLDKTKLIAEFAPSLKKIGVDIHAIWKEIQPIVDEVGMLPKQYQ